MTVDWFSNIVKQSEANLPHLATAGLRYLAIFTGALGVTLLLTPLFRCLALKLGMVDMPSERRINKKPIPRGGGLAIFCAFHLILAAINWSGGSSISTQFSFTWQMAFLGASTLLVLVGLWDDWRGLKPVPKLLGQIAAALILYFNGVNIGGIFVAFPAWLDCLATVLWIVGAINAFNLIDGMDGLATGLALIATMGLAGALFFAGAGNNALPYIILAGSCLGFLRYNFHPATVFLGDSGSMFLGLCIATLPLVTGMRKELVASLGMPLLAMGVPIFDTMLAIWRRSVRSLLSHGQQEGEGDFRQVMQPDCEHLHHRLMKHMSQRGTAIALYGVSLALVVLGLGCTLQKGRAPGLYLFAFFLAVFVVVRHLASVELWDTGRLLSGKRGTMRQGLLVPAYLVVDVVFLCLAWILARMELGAPISRNALLTDLPRSVVPVFAMLVVVRTYWRVWSRAQIREFVLLAVAVLSGSLMGAGLRWLFSDNLQDVLRFALLFGLFSLVPIVAIRIWRDTITGMTQLLERNILLAQDDTLRILAYGGGLRFSGYLKEMGRRSGNNDRVILGVIDDDINLQGRIVAGYKVVGTPQDVPRLARDWKLDGVIITCDLTPEKLAEVTHEFSNLGLSVALWRLEECWLKGQHSCMLEQQSD